VFFFCGLEQLAKRVRLAVLGLARPLGLRF
jgi:hypothetical protein